MAHFSYRDGQFQAEACDIQALAASIGTPFYCYSRAAITERYRALKDQLTGLPALICYAMKANSNQAVLTLLASLGAGMDVVSEGELRRARAAGVPGSKITFSGVGKTDAELVLGLDEDILCFNIESEDEMRRLAGLAAARGQKARISIRINPDVDAKTHAKISTGKAENKFGIPISRASAVYAEAAALPGLVATGVDMHIGSQITDLKPFDTAFGIMADLVVRLRAEGHTIDHIDLGGGLGIPYAQSEDGAAYGPDRYASLALKHFRHLDISCLFEPGRFLVGNAGILVTRVILVKTNDVKRFIVVDAAMNDLIRPTLYGAHHDILPVREPHRDAARSLADIVGPVCETGDFLAQARLFPEVAAGDLLAVCSAGAYGAVQAGTYNSRLLVPETLVDGERMAIVRPRTSYDALIGLDRVPDWFGP